MCRDCEKVFKMMEMKSVKKVQVRTHRQICVHNSTYKTLSEMGHVGQSFNDIIVQLLQIAKKVESNGNETVSHDASVGLVPHERLATKPTIEDLTGGGSNG